MNINSTIIILFSLFVFSALALVIIIDKNRLVKLKGQLEHEQKKRITPYLNISINRDDLTLRIVNEGDAVAQNISIEDITTVVDVGFQKMLVLKFKPIESLKPNEFAPLQISVFDNGNPLPSGMLRQVGGTLLTASFRAYIHCQNITGISFCSEVIKTRHQSKIASVAIVEPNTV